MNQDLLTALNHAFDKARSKQEAAAKSVKVAEDHVAFFKNKLEKSQEKVRFEKFRLDEVNRQHKALLEHYASAESRPQFIIEQLKDLVNQQLNLSERLRTVEAEESANKRDLEKAEAQLALAKKQESEADGEIVAVNEEIQRVTTLN